MDTVTSSLFIHCTNGNVKKLIELLEKYPDIDINKQNNYGSTPLMEACIYSHKEIVEILIQNNADINKADNEGWTALMIGCFNDHKKIVEILIRNNADINKANNYGHAALMITCGHGYREIVKILIKHELIMINFLNDVYNT